MSAMNPVNLSVEQRASLGAFTSGHQITPKQQSLLITWKQAQEDDFTCIHAPEILDVYYDPQIAKVVVELFDKSTRECTVVDADTLDHLEWQGIPF